MPSPIDPAYLEFHSYAATRTLLTLGAIALCLLVPRHWALERVRRRFAELSRRRGLAIVVVIAVSFLLTALLSLRRGIPAPHVHDEFSYLLAGDTFSKGRLTNPTPPMAGHFETMHVLVRPTYMSKYPPGQGLFLALGQVCGGNAIAGVWLSTALAAGAICWMLHAFVSPPWALLGGLMASFHPQILEWGNRYWGGNVAVLGGALALGGLARLFPLRRSRVRGEGQIASAVALAVGLFLIANTRPFEGLLLTVLVAPPWLWMWTRHRPAVIPRTALRTLVLLLVCACGWMAYYNFRISGNALRLPYVQHHRQYGVVPLFIFQGRSAEPAYSNEQLRLFYTREQEYWYARRGSWVKIREEAWKNCRRLYDGALGNVEALAIPLLLLPWFMLREKRIRLLSLLLPPMLLVLLSETYMYPHYAAPAAGLVAALLLMLLRRLNRVGHPLGPAAARVVVTLTFLWSLFWWIGFFNWKLPADDFGMRRQRIARQLESLPGKHLVFVRYGDHNVHEEWVYNGADLERAKVVWARDKGEIGNGRLVEVLADRRAWRLEADQTDADPVPVRGSDNATD